MRADEGSSLTRLTVEKLFREKLLFERLFVVSMFVLVVFFNLALIVIEAASPKMSLGGLVALSVGGTLAFAGQLWLLYSLRQQMQRRHALITQVSAALKTPAARPAPSAPTGGAQQEALSPQLLQVFESMGPDTTKH